MTVGLLVAVGLMVFDGGEIVVKGDAACPTPQQVAGRLRSLVPAGSEGGELVLSVNNVASGGAPAVELLLRRSDDRSVERRVVPRTTSCEGAAEVLAVIAATWLDPSLRALPPPRAAAAPQEVVVAATPSAGRRDTGTTLALWAGAGVTTAGDGGAARSARVGIAGWRSDNGWFGQIAASIVGERTVPFGPGLAVWQRAFGAVGGGRAWQTADLRLEVGAEVAAGGVSMAGRGLERDRSTVSFDLGVVPEVRVLGRIGQTPLYVWLGGGAAVWIRPHRVWAVGTAVDARLPALDMQLNAGLAWQLGR